MAMLDQDKKRQAVTLPATGPVVTVPKPAPALKRNDPFNVAIEPAASGAGGGRTGWGLNQPYVAAADAGRPVMAGTTTVPNAKPMRPQAPVGDAPGTKPVTVPALKREGGASTAQANLAPSQAMTLDQADARERAAATRASPASRQTDVGASVQAGGGSAPKPGSANTFTFSSGRTVALPPQGGDAAAPSYIRQRPIPQAVAATVPRVASTFGQSVLSMPDDNVVRQSASRPTATGGMTLPSGGAFRSADRMSEQYASRESREAQAKLLSDLDSQRFRLEMIAQNPGRRGREALQQLGENARQQAAIVGGAAGVAAGAEQSRAANDTRLAGIAMEQEGKRADLANALALEDKRQEGENARYAGRPVTPITAEDGTMGRVGEDGVFTPITTADGEPVRGQQSIRTTGGLEAGDVLKAYTEQMAAIQGSLAKDDQKAAAMQQLDASPLGQRYGQLLNGGGANAGAGAGKPTLDQWMASARQANPGVSDAELRAYYNSTYR